MEDNYTINIKSKWYDLEREEKEDRISYAKELLGKDITAKLVSSNKMSDEEREKVIAELRLDEYQRLLNQEGQDKLMTLEEFCDNTPDIPNKVIFRKIASLKFAHKYNFVLDEERVFWFAHQKPYTYLSIIPVYNPHSNSILLGSHIAISDEAVKVLQKECEQECERLKRKQIEKLKMEIEKDRKSHLF